MTNRSATPLDAGQLLRSRALALARPVDAEPEALSQLELLEFRLATERYAVETMHVHEVHPLKELTPLPGTPTFIRGVVNVRGLIVPVLDLKKFFNLPEEGLTDLHRIILVTGNNMTLGLLADAVDGVRRVRADSLQPSLPTLTGVRNRYLKGVTAEHLIVLDVPGILADPDLIVDDEVDPRPLPANGDV